jgi:hypothetical protein
VSEKDALGRILASEDTLVPSSGFAARVMDAVEESASAPPPLPFPWRRFSLAVVAILLSVASGLWLLLDVDLSRVIAPLTDVAPELGYAAAMIILTLVMLYGPRMRVTARRWMTTGIWPLT